MIVHNPRDSVSAAEELPLDATPEAVGLERRFIVYMGTLMSLGGLLWGGLAMGYGLTWEALVPFSYVIITVLNLGFSANRANDLASHELMRAVQILASLLLPFAFQFVLGGFVASGVVMLWALIALFGSLISPRLRSGSMALALFAVLTIVSAVLEPVAAKRTAAAIVADHSLPLLTMNVVLVSTLAFGLALALAHNRDEVARRLRAANQRNLDLNGRLSRTVEYLYRSQINLHDTTDSLHSSIDALKATQQELVQREKLASLGSLVAGIAHEINTPLGVAVTASSLVKEGLDAVRPALPAGAAVVAFEDVDDALRLLVANVHRASELIRQFRTVAVDQSAGGLRTFELCAYIREVVGNLAPLIRRTAVSVSVFERSDVMVTQRPGLVAQVVTNIVTNALQHAYGANQEGVLEFSVSVDAGRVEIRAVDRGKGMSPEVAARAFDPFFTTRGGAGGSGLGLFIVHNLVSDGLHGHVHLESAVGQGTTFIIQFPAVAKDA
jgi:signal transduction histidine kinase